MSDETVSLEDYGPVTLGSGDGGAFKFEPPELTREDLEAAETIDGPFVVHLQPDGSGEILR